MAQEAAGRSVDLERRAGVRPPRWCLSLIARARFNNWIGQYDLALNDLEEAVGLARTIKEQLACGDVLTELSTIARLRDDKESALRFAREAYEAAIEPTTGRARSWRWENGCSPPVHCLGY